MTWLPLLASKSIAFMCTNPNTDTDTHMIFKEKCILCNQKVNCSFFSCVYIWFGAQVEDRGICLLLWLLSCIVYVYVSPVLCMYMYIYNWIFWDSGMTEPGTFRWERMGNKPLGIFCHPDRQGDCRCTPQL